MARILPAPSPPPAPALIRSLARPLFGVFGGPAAWILQLIVNYALATYPCMPNDTPFAHMPPSWSWSRPVVFAINILALIVALASAFVGVADFRRTREWQAHGPDRGRDARVRFLAYCGLMSGWMFSAAIAFNTVNLIGGPSCSG